MKKNLLKKIVIVTGLFFISIAAYQYYPAARSVYRQIQTFSAVLERIHDEYVEEKDAGDLVETAIRGMLDTLDPHTTFMNPEEFREWNQNFEGYSGIGIYFDIIADKIAILSVIPGGPSEMAGLKSGDRIVAINGESTAGLKRDDVPRRLMGPKGTRVTIAVERRGWEDIRQLEIVRDEVRIESVPYAFMLGDGIGYIYISRFSSGTADEFETALNTLEKKGMRRLLLDLRQNGGGYLDAAVSVTDQFLAGGKRIVYTDGRVRSAFREFFSSDNKDRPVPVVVIIDRISASASEIVAGALQDWDRAYIVGEISFGKGVVQSQYRFQDGSALLMTTARYHTPTGRIIQRPYDGKTAVDYYAEIWTDSLQNAPPDPSAPVYETLNLKRPVYGGGGIRPDRILSARKDTLNRVVRNLVFAPERFLFSFTEHYVDRHPELRMDFGDFLRDYRPDAAMMRQFLGFLRGGGFSISDAEFMKNSDQIADLLKENIASAIWGDIAGYQVEMLRDRQLAEALTCFPRAEKLFEMSRAPR